ACVRRGLRPPQEVWLQVQAAGRGLGGFLADSRALRLRPEPEREALRHHPGPVDRGPFLHPSPVREGSCAPCRPVALTTNRGRTRADPSSSTYVLPAFGAAIFAFSAPALHPG